MDTRSERPVPQQHVHSAETIQAILQQDVAKEKIPVEMGTTYRVSYSR